MPSIRPFVLATLLLWNHQVQAQAPTCTCFCLKNEVPTLIGPADLATVVAAEISGPAPCTCICPTATGGFSFVNVDREAAGDVDDIVVETPAPTVAPSVSAAPSTSAAPTAEPCVAAQQECGGALPCCSGLKCQSFIDNISPPLCLVDKDANLESRNEDGNRDKAPQPRDRGSTRHLTAAGGVRGASSTTSSMDQEPTVAVMKLPLTRNGSRSARGNRLQRGGGPHSLPQTTIHRPAVQ